MAQLETIHFHQSTLFSGLTGTVDKDNCIVRGISLITAGVTATGHDLFVDDQSVESFHRLGTAMKKVPVLLDHGSGIISMNGTIQGFRKDGDKWRGDWHLLKTHDETPVMLERCETMPECFGFSLAFSGDKQGVKRNGKKCAHPEALLSADCVVRPAANKSLFSVKEGPSISDIITLAQLHSVDTQKNFVSTKTPNLKFMAGENQNQNQEPTLADIMNTLQGLGQRLDAFEQVQSQLVDHVNGSVDDQSGIDPSFLEALFNASDEELAAYNEQNGSNITRDEINAAVGEYNASLGEEAQVDATQQQTNGSQEQGDDAGLAAAASSGNTALAAVAKELINLKAERANEIKFAEAQAEAQAAQSIEMKFAALVKKNEQLIALNARTVAENEALRLAGNTGGKPVAAGIEFSEAVKNGEAISFEQAVIHKFNELVKKKGMTELKAKSQAISFAVKKHESAYKHYRSQGSPEIQFQVQ